MAERFEGYNGSVEVGDGEIVMRRRGAHAALHGLSSEPRTIPFSSITEVELREATRWRNGWLRIGLDGKPLQPVLQPRTDDENAVLFLHRSREDFGRLHELLSAIVAGRHNAD